MTQLIQIISAIKNGNILCLPTDTLYSLSCDATNNNAVKKIFQAKGRDFNKPLPIFVHNLKQAKQYAFFNDKALLLAEKFWPGALTLILPLKINSNLSKYVYGSNKNIAIRIPKHQLLLQILREIQLPLVATSANRSATPNKFTLEEVKTDFKEQINLYVENNEPVQINEPSTIIDCCTEKIIITRQGKVTIKDITRLFDL